MYAGSSDVALSRRTLPIASATTTMIRRRRSAAPAPLRTRGGRLLDVSSDVEVADVHRVYPLHLPIRQRRMVRRRDELLDLLLVVDVRQRRQHRSMGVEPQQRELADRHAAFFAQRLQTLDFLQSLDEPGTRAMGTVIALIEL